MSQHVQEIGVRIAIGATARDVASLVLRERMLAIACAVLMATATLGCLIPARRATRVDPVALRA